MEQLLAKETLAKPMYTKSIDENDDGVTFQPSISINHVNGQLSSMPRMPLYITCSIFIWTFLSHTIYYI